LKNGIAIASLVIGIVSFFTLSLMGIGAVVGITLAIVALVKANRYPAEYGGKGLAIAGLTSSVLSIVIIVPIGIIAAIAIPNLLASRRAANEGSALHAMRDFSSAEESYFSVYGKYGTLEQLAAANLIDDQLASGTRNGYRFKITLPISASRAEQGFETFAVPAEYPNTGRRSFFMNQTGVICGADKHGIEATSLDPPLDLHWSSSESGNNRRASGSYSPASAPASSY
jgi:type IV pilus assembly protein PilA